jgi:hypothetical protein
MSILRHFGGSLCCGAAASIAASAWLLLPSDSRIASPDSSRPEVVEPISIESHADRTFESRRETFAATAVREPRSPMEPVPAPLNSYLCIPETHASQVCVLDDGRVVGVSADGGRGDVVHMLPADRPGLAMTLAGDWIRTADGLRLWRLESGSEGVRFVERSLHTGALDREFECKECLRWQQTTDAALSHDGRFLVVCERDEATRHVRRLAVFDAGEGRLLRHVAIPAAARGAVRPQLAFRGERVHLEWRANGAPRTFACSPETGDLQLLGD